MRCRAYAAVNFTAERHLLNESGRICAMKYAVMV